ncbi:tetraspanin-12-like [Solanum tuberosum]|uniref:Senescence-associated protein 5 n=1 Tax=Solanum tuberosum TaxID=4113 RepID=M1DXA5_SOLTU|nr:PREDICTED: tetraspanin-12-like [Solanum tuberosum]XP_015163127.1 PREDICTED: tetraspanin-12-like [Solanum tuberosum]
MARVSPNCIFGCAGLVVSLAFIGFSVWLHFSDIPTLCVKVLEKPSLILGLIVLISLGFGLIVAFYPVKFIFWISKISYCLILLGLLYFAVFSILVTNRNVSRALFGRDGNYSDYLLEKYVMNAEQIKSCLVDFQVCPNIPTAKGAEFYKYCLSPAQLSCCILPAQCTLVLQNDTYWIMPKAGPAVANNDGKNWSTVESELCFNCQSCKTASYNIIKKHWKITSFITLFIVFVCCVDFCALKFKNRSKGPQRNKVYPV